MTGALFAICRFVVRNCARRAIPGI